MINLMPFILAILFITALLRVSFAFQSLYILIGVYLLTNVWSQRAINAVEIRRTHDTRALLDDALPVRLEVENRGLLPIPWLRIHDRLPLHLASPPFFTRITSLLPREKQVFCYELHCRQRGYYSIGALDVSSGDVFGLTSRMKRFAEPGHVTVYPRIVPLDELGLPCRAPFGHLRTQTPLYEDPARVIGTRDYQNGDSMRKIDWKTTAASGRLQIRKAEPAMTLQTVILLNLNLAEYEGRNAFYATEMAIVVAASIASHLAGLRQEVALVTNGADPLSEGEVVGLGLCKGREQITGILELLGRANARIGTSFCQVLYAAAGEFPWGATLVVIASRESEELWAALLTLRRLGFGVTVVFCDYPSPFAFERAQRRGASLGFSCHRIWQVEDIDVWRRHTGIPR